VLTEGDTLMLANGWKIERRKVSNENRVELVGPSHADYGLLKEMGAFTEIINYKTRLFIPSQGAETLARILKSKPVIEVIEQGGEDSPRFSRAAGTTQGISTENLIKHVAQIMKGWQNRPMIQIVTHFTELPEAIQKEALKGSDGSDIEGVWHQGYVYLVAENIESLARAETVIFHEVLGHYGLRKMLGDKLNPLLKARYQTFSEEGKALYKAVRDHYRDRSGAVYQALADRIDRAQVLREEKAKLKAKLRLRFESARVTAPYFPLARFGDYWVQVKDGEESGFYMFESAQAQSRFARQQQAKGHEVSVGKSLENIKAVHGASEGFLSDVMGMS
jgi:hypothetical protein